VHPCLLSGAHHWYIEETSNHIKKNVNGKCCNCGLELKFPARFSYNMASGQVVLKTKVSSPSGVKLPPKLEPISGYQTKDLDLLFDALSYVRVGNWDSFVTVTSQIDDSPWFASNFARLLSALGHMDLLLNRHNMRPQFWKLVDPVLVLLPDTKSATLLGYRTKKLVEAISHFATSLGGELKSEKYPGCPGVLIINGLSEYQLVNLAVEVKKELGITLTVNKSQIGQMLGLLNDIDEILLGLDNFTIPSGVRTERYRPRSFQWENVNKIAGPGAYRFYVRPIQYAFVTPSFVKIGDNPLVKYFACATEEVPMLAYDSDSQSLICKMGSQLPGLFERVAVMCTGRPPIAMIDGTVVYNGVKRDIALGIWNRLGPKSIRGGPNVK
jgi:hypothetical protein